MPAIFHAAVLIIFLIVGNEKSCRTTVFHKRSNVSQCLNSAETLFQSFTASKAQVIGRKFSVFPTFHEQRWQNSNLILLKSSALAMRREYTIIELLLCIVLFCFKSCYSCHFTSLCWRLTPLHSTAGLNVPGAVAVSLSVGHSILTGSRTDGPPRPGWPLTIHWLRTFITMLYTLTTTAPLQKTDRNTHISLSDNGL